MSVLIKGVKMPETCSECYLREKNSCPILRCIVEGYYRPGFCPLVEVPSPHGRLIDADALMLEFAKFARASNNSDFAPVPRGNDAVSLLGSAPTIIEAEEE